MEDEVIRSTPEKQVFLSTGEVSERLGISRDVLGRMRIAGDGPRFRQLRRRGPVLYRLEDVLAFEERRTLQQTEANPRKARPVQGGARHGS